MSCAPGNTEGAISELDRFFESHAYTLPPEQVIGEIESIANRYGISSVDVFVPYIKTQVRETAPADRPGLHDFGPNYVTVAYLSTHDADDLPFTP